MTKISCLNKVVCKIYKQPLLVIFFFCFLLSNTGCNAQNLKNFDSYTCSFNNEIDLNKTDSINISLKSYFQFHVEDKFVTFEDVSQKIYVYDTNKYLLVDSIDLNLFDNSILSIFPQTLDSIYLLTKNNELKLIINKLETINQWKFKNKEKDILYTQMHPFCDFPFYVRNQTLYIQKYNINCSYNQKKCLVENIESEIDLISLKKKDIPLKYPTEFLSSEYTIHLRGFTRIYTDKYHVYNFKIDSNLYLFNKDDETVKEVNAKADYQFGIKPFNETIESKFDNKTQSVLDYFSTVSQYPYLIYDQFNNYYYRIYLHGQDLTNEQGLFNEFNKRQIILLVFDDSFKKIAEIELDSKLYNFGVIPLRIGLAVPRKDLINNKIQYDIFKIHNI
jgi:hypothetical protein